MTTAVTYGDGSKIVLAFPYQGGWAVEVPGEGDDEYIGLTEVGFSAMCDEAHGIISRRKELAATVDEVDDTVV